MLEVGEKAVAYFRTAANDPWRWAENADVMVAADGTTIVFREELASILEGLSGNGLPPFRAVMVLLAAFHGKFPSRSDNETESSADGFAALCDRLREIYNLPKHLRNSPRAKSILLQSVFDNLNVSRVIPGREIVAWLRDFAREDLNTDNTSKDLANTYRLLSAGLRHFSPEALALRMQTGLDALPEAIDLDLGPSDQVRSLLDHLSHDPEQEGLAKLVRDVMAALYLPRSLSEIDELALGGYSDICNRGNLDRLLPSELAHDDNTLAARIALNEALYLRREPPSNHPPTKIAILVDVGVRQWGLPRIFATAVTLALIAKQKVCGGVSVWRAKRHGMEEANLLTRDGLVKHLAVIDTYDHPGGALPAFFSELAGTPDVETFLITHRDCLSDPEFQRSLGSIDWNTFYISTVDRLGNFTLSNYRRWQTPLCEAQFCLDSLFGKKKSAAGPKLFEAARNTDLPIIFATKPFPLLLPVVGNVDCSLKLQTGGGIAVMKDRRLLHWAKDGQGAETAFEFLAPGRTVWFGTTHSDQIFHVLKSHPKEKSAALACFRKQSGEAVDIKFELQKEPRRVFEHNGVLFLVFASEVTAIDLNDGRTLGTTPIPHPAVASFEKYFSKGDRDWSFVVYDGMGVSFQPIQLHFGSDSTSKILALFDRAGAESLPWALTDRGSVFSGDGKRVINLGRLISSFKISADGNRILVPGVGGRDFQLIDLEKNVCPLIQARHAQRQFETPVIVPTRSVRVKLEAVAFALDGELFLKTSDGTWRKLSLIQDNIRTEAVANPMLDETRVRVFQNIASPSEFNLKLKIARWSDNTKVWLDSRGLLHLRRVGVPEISLVLSDGPMAVWSSDGKICGPRFFIGNQTPDDPALLLKKIQMCAPAL